MSVLRPKSQSKGFTLVEMLVVVLILAILMAVALPLYLGAIQESQRRTCRANMQTIANAEQAWKLKNPDHRYGTAAELLTDPATPGQGNNLDLPALPICPLRTTADSAKPSYSVTTDVNQQLKITCLMSATKHGDFQPGRDKE